MDGFQIDWFGSPRPGERLRPLSATSAEDGKFELRGIRLTENSFAMLVTAMLQLLRHCMSDTTV